MNTLSVIPQIQVTLGCNSCCSYCFQKHSGGIIDLSIVEAILKQTVSINNGLFSKNRPITLTWHGGEPLLAGIEFFRQVIRLQSQFSKIVFNNQIQTNGTLMTKDLAQLFANHHFQVGFSLDGPENIHNRHRVFKDSGMGNFFQTMEGIELFRQFSKQDAIPVIAVITNDSMGKEDEIFNFFKELKARVQLDIYDIRCLDMAGPVINKSSVFRLAPTPCEVGQFLIRLFDLWFHDTSGRVDFPELRNEVKMILQPQINKGDPFHKKRCNLARIIFAPDGKAYSCDQYVNDDKTALGDIKKDTLKKILINKSRLWEQIKIHIRKSSKDMACSTCEWGHQHMGGCLSCMKYNSLLLKARQKGLSDDKWFDAELTSPLDQIFGETYYCAGLKAFRAHAKKNILQELTDAGAQRIRTDTADCRDPFPGNR